MLLTRADDELPRHNPDSGHGLRTASVADAATSAAAAAAAAVVVIEEQWRL